MYNNFDTVLESFQFGGGKRKGPKRGKKKSAKKMSRGANKFKKSKKVSGCQKKVMTGGKCRKRR